jgi:ATP-dependent Lon protease
MDSFLDIFCIIECCLKAPRPDKPHKTNIYSVLYSAKVLQATKRRKDKTRSVVYVSRRQASIDELVAVWLLREYLRNWKYIEKTAEFLGLSQKDASTIINKPNFSKPLENHFRWLFLQFRYPLLRPFCDGAWYEETMSESQFKNLMVIASDPTWRYLSNVTGKLATVATNVFKADYKSEKKEINEMMQAIKEILNSNIDTQLFVIKSEKSELMTILEGNKSAVALYIRHFIENKGAFQPFKFFMGYLRSKSVWQW